MTAAEIAPACQVSPHAYPASYVVERYTGDPDGDVHIESVLCCDAVSCLEQAAADAELDPWSFHWDSRVATVEELAAISGLEVSP